MKTFSEFLDSLATRGGTVLILVIMVLSSCALVIHVLHHDNSNAQLVNTSVSLLTGFTSALTLALTGGQRLANGKNGNGQTNGSANGSSPIAPQILGDPK